MSVSSAARARANSFDRSTFVCSASVAALSAVCCVCTVVISVRICALVCVSRRRPVGMADTGTYAMSATIAASVSPVVAAIPRNSVELRAS
jgi:hypothetical protein